MPRKEKTFKEIHGKTKIGMFLKKNAPNLLDLVLKTAGGFIPGAAGITGMISGMIKKNQTGELNVDTIAHGVSVVEMEFADIANARAMQVAALGQDDVFSKRFVYYLATFWSVVGASYMFCATYIKVENEHVMDIILGFLLGTIVATIITFFFGSSKGSKDSNKQLAEIFKNGK